MQEEQFICHKEVIYQGNHKPEIKLKQGTSLTLIQIESIFQFGLWRFESANQLIFQPISSLFSRLFPLTAIYKKVGTVYKFQAERVLELEKVFLDGIIYIEDKSLILDITYSLSTPSELLQIARIIQKLEPTDLSIDEFEESRKSEISFPLESERSLSIIDELELNLEIDSRAIIKKYSVVLEGNTETESFPSLVSDLFITFPAEGEKPKSIQLTSKMASEIQPGFINWNCELLERFSEEEWYSATSQSIYINLKYQEQLPTTNLIWYSRVDNILTVMGESLSINLVLDRDRITGNISATGCYSDSLNPATYEATIVGEIEKSKVVEKLRQSLNCENSSFTGCWLTDLSHIGEIKLQQNGDRVTGTYNLTGEIVGIVEGNLLEFSWTNGIEKGWGYLRSLNRGGILFGMWGSGDFPDASQAIIARWQLPINIEIASQLDEIFLRELRWLGHELMAEGRYEQGINILEEALQLYRDRRQQTNLSYQDEFSYLNGEYLTLIAYILRFNIYLGNYNRLIGNLTYLIEIVELLDAERSLSNFIRERTDSLNKERLESTVELDSAFPKRKTCLVNLVMETREFLIKGILDSLDKGTTNPKESSNISQKSQTILAELYLLLIEAIASLLDTPSSTKIIIIPHGSLFLIPFATLINPKTNRYFIEEHSIVLSPSIQTLDLTQQKLVNHVKTENILVIGNPQMPYYGDLPQLPYTESAAKAISNLFKTKPLLGKQATKTEILARLPQANIIHFGTHGKLDDLQPLDSGIALTPEGEDNGFLTVGDILARFAPPQTLSLNAELVVLSACATGLGKITGDGVFGLARGLMAAGVKTVLVSLWEVQDFPTACLMLQFYKCLQGGNAPIDALRKAQLWLKNITNNELLKWLRQEKFSLNSIQKQRIKTQIEESDKRGNFYPFQHPYYWGAFYIIGAD